MIIAATSDIHGNLPELKEDFNVLVIAGDLLPHFDSSAHTEIDRRRERLSSQMRWMREEFTSWLESNGWPTTIIIGGNHDELFAVHPPKSDAWTYLEDSSVTIGGVKFYGTPWVINLVGWPFYASEFIFEDRVKQIPDDTDVLITHNPPTGRGSDTVSWGELGFAPLRDKADSLDLKAHIFGHIHEGFGFYRGLNGHPSVNVAHVDNDYVPTNPVVYLEI